MKKAVAVVILAMLGSAPADAAFHPPPGFDTAVLTLTDIDKMIHCTAMYGEVINLIEGDKPAIALQLRQVQMRWSATTNMLSVDIAPPGYFERQTSTAESLAAANGKRTGLGGLMRDIERDCSRFHDILHKNLRQIDTLSIP